MLIAKDGDTVKVHYTGRLEDGTIFDSSQGREPLEFTLGDGMVIEGFDTGVVGMSVGQKKTIVVPPEQGYGEYEPAYVRELPRDEINIGVEPQVGMQLELRTPVGESIPIVITEVTEETVTLDANHPLAGETLYFEVELLEVV